MTEVMAVFLSRRLAFLAKRVSYLCFFSSFCPKTAKKQRSSEKITELLKDKMAFIQSFLVKKGEYRQANLFFIGEKVGKAPFNFCDRNRYLL
jgi:hypothetical protein